MCFFSFNYEQIVVCLVVVCSLNIFLLNRKASIISEVIMIKIKFIYYHKPPHLLYSCRTGQITVFVPEEVNIVAFVNVDLSMIAGGLGFFLLYGSAVHVLLAQH